ncbi:MAG TPA: xanthine dehydrogenase family protein molybdopterin-binding subunit [Steroidobacteraceae bacterium]
MNDVNRSAVPPPADDGVSRRHFLVGAGVVGAGLLIGLKLAHRSDRFAPAADVAASGQRFSPDAFVHIAPDNQVTIVIGKSEMGQGVHTSLPMILAEELDVDPARVRVEFAPVNKAFNHPMLPAQFTGGSSSVLSTYQALRESGAYARSLLLAAAGKRWNVDPASLQTLDGVVTDGSRRATYGEFALDAAALLPAAVASPGPGGGKGAPASVALKDPKNFRYIGKPHLRLDGPDKVTGKTQFGLDVQRPDMLIAMVARPPVFGAQVRSFKDTATRAVAGVVDVKQVPSGIAVLATNTWAARRGREALEIDWDLGPNADLSTAAISAAYRKLAEQPGALVTQVGDVVKALGASSRKLDVTYEVPYLAHAPMEPLNCVVHVTDGKCEIWTGTQFQSQDAQMAAAVLGLKPEQVLLHTMFLGGGFGRRASNDSDFVVEAVHVARGVGRPVKVVWTREDDVRGGHYRPYWVSRFRGAVDAAGKPVAWHHTVVGQSVMKPSNWAKFMVKNGIDPTSVEGASDLPYAMPNLRVDLHSPDQPVTILWWRSVGHSHIGFVVNSFLDELAHLGGQDPVALRRELLADKPRHRAVLDAVAKASGWGEPLPAGRYRGVALEQSFGSIVAEVAEVSVEGANVRVHRVVCAIDCGVVVNPQTVRAQMESGIVYGLSAALHGEITLDKGRVQQGNFNDYPVLRINEMPVIETVLVPNGGPLGGVGEPGTPPIAAAVCNAIFAATGKRIRRLPISSSLTA